MTEVATACLVPGIMSPLLSNVYSAALVWDHVMAPLAWSETKREQDGSPDRAALARLQAEGVLSRPNLHLPADAPKPRGLNPVWEEAFHKGIEGRASESDLVERYREAMNREALVIADHHTARARAAIALAAQVNAAPLASEFLPGISPLLPESLAEAPVREAALISVAVESVVVSDTTNPDDLLAFRAKNKQSIARLRASLIDLAATMREGGGHARTIEEARAVLVNRVEPALGDLESCLRGGRIQYFWKALFGASALLAAPLAPAAAVEGAGRMASQTLSYAFDREKLLREHPFGYLHQLRSTFETQERLMAPGAAITDPAQQMRDVWQSVLNAAFGPELPKYVRHSLDGDDSE